jgi:hypothetical protein
VNTAWTVEVEYVSADRKAKTGNGIIRNGRGKFVCKAPLSYARKIVRAVNGPDARKAKIITISYYATDAPEVTLPKDLQQQVKVRFVDLLEQDYLVLEHEGLKVYRTYKDECCGSVQEWSEYHLATERMTDWENDIAFDWRELPEIPQPELAQYESLYPGSELKQRVAYAIDQGWITEHGLEDPTRAHGK